MLTPFRIKICGVKRAADLAWLADSGADAVGLNFVRTSVRCLKIDPGREMVKQAQGLGLKTVAVLMNPTADELRKFLSTVPVDFLQLHGEERPELLNDMPDIAVIKAVSWSGRREEKHLARLWLESDIAARGQLCGYLVDAFAPGVGGGTGRTARWDLLAPPPTCFGDIPILLAGGLTPANVAEAILTTRCAGVDTASGVETSPGCKDEALVADFVRSANESFAASLNSQP
jgi:phosphoribosylanthranilate isomerase